MTVHQSRSAHGDLRLALLGRRGNRQHGVVRLAGHSDASCQASRQTIATSTSASASSVSDLDGGSLGFGLRGGQHLRLRYADLFPPTCWLLVLLDIHSPEGNHCLASTTCFLVRILIVTFVEFDDLFVGLAFAEHLSVQKARCIGWVWSGNDAIGRQTSPVFGGSAACSRFVE
ncbi:hypothetical protein LZ30DRAFT_709453 [Colletotrichum cereale]|nr:hypothetical protein LZ30DRAFT_709453 [Colletotrichum cereale]